MDKVLVGIPTLNGPNRLEDCLNAIYRTHDIHQRERYEPMLVVLDDGSSSDNLAENKKICGRRGVSLITNKTRGGIPAAWNRLMGADEADYCILLNDDVFVSEHWIECILFTLKHNPSIGVVGLNAYEGYYSSLPANNVPTYTESKILLGSPKHPILSARGYAFGFRQADFKKIGGFDTRYFYFFEEVDFNLNMMKICGKRNCMLSYPMVKHLHGDTLLKLDDHSQVFQDSQRKFETKWGTRWSNIRSLFNSNTMPKINHELEEWNTNIHIWG